VKGKIKYIYNGEELYAEEFAIRYYQEKGYKAKWTENYFWWQILCLLFWDIIFAKISGAVIIRKSGYDYELDPDDDEFEEYFQKIVIEMNGMPHDLFTESFYERRKQLINNRIKELEHSDLITKLKVSYQKNYGKNCRLIEDWSRFSLEDLIDPITHINKNVIIGICHRILKNVSSYRSGLPDLLVYSENKSFFVEVKSKNDKLNDNQKNWHDFISENLKFDVELFLINHSERQISNLKNKKKNEPEIKVRISFGKSTSKKREEAIAFISNQESFEKKEENNDVIYSAEFSTKDIESLFKMLDLTSGWKSKKIEINNNIVRPIELRNSLYCYRQKNKEKASFEWCVQDEYNDGKKNPFGCKKIYFHQFMNGRWNEYGYIDTDLGIWIFDKDSIIEELKNQIERVKYCPLLNPSKVLTVVDSLPDRINPKDNPDWAFISQDYEDWIWHNGKWISSGWGDKKFPSFTLITGVQKLNKKERNEIIKRNSGKSDFDNVITINLTSTKQKSKKQQSGCFVATTVYGNYNHPNVLLLRKFRDKYLLRKKIGRIFISLYYHFGFIFSSLIENKVGIKKLIMNLLDNFIKVLNKKYDLN